jgi:uncharacterized protein (TIGR02118 family)
MYKVILLYPAPSDPERFRRHYLATHVPLCRKVPGRLRFSYGLGPEALGADSPWFCVFESEFASEAAWRDAMTSPEALAARADVAKFTDRLPTMIAYTMAG